MAFWVFKPFILVFAVSACVALLLAPVQKRFDKALGGKPTLAAALLVLLTTVVILVPMLTSLFLLARQTALFLDWIRLQPLVGPEEMQRFWERAAAPLPGPQELDRVPAGADRADPRAAASRSSRAARTVCCRTCSAA